MVSPSLPCASCRRVDRLETTRFLSATGVGHLVSRHAATREFYPESPTLHTTSLQRVRWACYGNVCSIASMLVSGHRLATYAGNFMYGLWICTHSPNCNVSARMWTVQQRTDWPGWRGVGRPLGLTRVRDVLPGRGAGDAEAADGGIRMRRPEKRSPSRRALSLSTMIRVEEAE